MGTGNTDKKSKRKGGESARRRRKKKRVDPQGRRHRKLGRRKTQPDANPARASRGARAPFHVAHPIRSLYHLWEISKTADGGRRPAATIGRDYRYCHAETDGLEDETDSVLRVVSVLKPVDFVVKKGVDAKLGTTPCHTIFVKFAKNAIRRRSRYTGKCGAKKGGEQRGRAKE